MVTSVSWEKYDRGFEWWGLIGQINPTWQLVVQAEPVITDPNQNRCFLIMLVQNSSSVVLYLWEKPVKLNRRFKYSRF